MIADESLPDERKEYIKAKLKSAGKVIAADLCQELAVSIHTIRRDLAELAEGGLCKRVYGGALSLVTHTQMFTERTTLATDRKRALAIASQALVQKGQCLFIDAGSTNLAIANELCPELELTVVTNSPLIAAALMERRNFKVINLGGVINKDVGGVVGVSALTQIKDFTFDLVFLGACAIDPGQGLTAVDFEDATFKRLVSSRASQVAVALLSEKINSVAPFKVSEIEQVDVLILEKNAPSSSIADFSKRCSLLFG
ncbi:DeoR/GlpR family DNA-binding transcription regulator [Pseudomonas fulva]|uniref:DeoR/GlpR family DNA-binding transcription regulator n=1 Tax=Pseudomonas fulva TaxID=47880 RepID=UPI0018A890D0|nr:DeoR/GlpR family DNA-binding transcription regulator [Pseudomonas fulva]MBF8774060.1 DeoR/GlpR transcriptional regulator [Pseudomonas fulva]